MTQKDTRTLTELAQSYKDLSKEGSIVRAELAKAELRVDELEVRRDALFGSRWGQQGVIEQARLVLRSQVLTEHDKGATKVVLRNTKTEERYETNITIVSRVTPKRIYTRSPGYLYETVEEREPTRSYYGHLKIDIEATVKAYKENEHDPAPVWNDVKYKQWVTYRVTQLIKGLEG